MPYPQWYALMRGDSVVFSPTYRVAEVRAVDGSAAPPEIVQRFQGRLWSLSDLERRGVRIAGANAWYFSSGQDWQLTLTPAS
jgi:hypothetical protein